MNSVLALFLFLNFKSKTSEKWKVWKVSHDLDPYFSGKLHKQVSCLKKKDYKLQNKKIIWVCNSIVNIQLF